MKKTLSIIFATLLCLALFVACSSETEPGTASSGDIEVLVSDADIAANTTSAEETGKVIKPLPETLDVNNLDNCTVAVSLEEGGAYVNDEGKMMMDLTVYTYELYDMVDIATLAENDVIVRRNEEVKVASVERLDSGLININGGEENGGFSLISNDSTVYYEVGMSDYKAYNELGKVSIPVSVDFLYTDESNLDAEPVVYYPGDFLIDTAGIEYNFHPNNTSVVIQDGYIVAMNKLYTP